MTITVKDNILASVAVVILVAIVVVCPMYVLHSTGETAARIGRFFDRIRGFLDDAAWMTQIAYTNAKVATVNVFTQLKNTTANTVRRITTTYTPNAATMVRAVFPAIKANGLSMARKAYANAKIGVRLAQHAVQVGAHKVSSGVQGFYAKVTGRTRSVEQPVELMDLTLVRPDEPSDEMPLIPHRGRPNRVASDEIPLLSRRSLSSARTSSTI